MFLKIILIVNNGKIENQSKIKTHFFLSQSGMSFESSCG